MISPYPEGCLTAADALRRAIHALYDEWEAEGALNVMREPPAPSLREHVLGRQLDYHLGAADLAELVGDQERAAFHLEAFCVTTERYFALLDEREQFLRTPPKEA